MQDRAIYNVCIQGGMPCHHHATPSGGSPQWTHIATGLCWLQKSSSSCCTLVGARIAGVQGICCTGNLHFRVVICCVNCIQVLRFFGYFLESVVESNIENYRVRVRISMMKGLASTRLAVCNAVASGILQPLSNSFAHICTAPQPVGLCSTRVCTCVAIYARHRGFFTHACAQGPS